MKVGMLGIIKKKVNELCLTLHRCTELTFLKGESRY